MAVDMASLLTWWVTGMIMSDVAGGMAEGANDVAASSDVTESMTWQATCKIC